MMDQKTYNDLMNYLIKGKYFHINSNLAECKRIERDKVLQSQIANP